MPLPSQKRQKLFCFASTQARRATPVTLASRRHRSQPHWLPVSIAFAAEEFVPRTALSSAFSYFMPNVLPGGVGNGGRPRTARPRAPGDRSLLTRPVIPGATPPLRANGSDRRQATGLRLPWSCDAVGPVRARFALVDPGCGARLRLYASNSKLRLRREFVLNNNLYNDV